MAHVLTSPRAAVAAVATPLLALALLTGCGSDSQSGNAASPTSATSETAPGNASGSPAASPTSPGTTDESGAAAPTVTSNGVTVSGNRGEQPKVTVTPGEPAPAELVALDIYPGSGAELEAGGSGVFEYEGVLFSDGTTFDSSWDRGSPIAATLQRVIPGWQEGLVGMQAGGRRLLIVPPDLAYGIRALPGIPPNSTLVFVVDLKEVTG